MKFLAIILSLWTITLQAIDPLAVQKIIDQYLPDGHVGVFVQRSDTGEVLLDVNAKQHFTPASTAKLFTSYAALKSLEPNFQFKTGLFLDPTKIQQGIYTGPIYIQFTGDPSFNSNDITQFVQAIKTAGIKQINGSVILDVGTVPAPYYAPGWAQEDLDWYFAAPISAAIIDENKVNLQLQTHTAPGQRLSGRVTNQPSLPVTSYVVSVQPQDTINLCQLNTSIDQNNQIILYGCWPTGKNPAHLEMALHNPAQRVAQILEMNFKNQQIVLNGKIAEGKMDVSAPLFTQKLSDPLPELLIPVLRQSNNLYTESLAKQIGQNEFQRATFQAGANAIQKICNDTLGLPKNSIQLYDGSGLSNYNMTTPEALAAVLKSAYADPVMQPILMNSLSYAGQNGTLGARMATKDLVGRFIGKTGSMSHISNLAGYLFRTAGEEPLIVIVMVNQTSAGKQTLRAFEVALMRSLMK